MRNLLILSSVLAIASCAGRSGSDVPAEADEQPVAAPFVRYNVDSTTTLWSIRDNATERSMPNSLFYGESDSALVEQLSTSGGVPSSVSCFVVEAGGKRVLFDTGNGSDKGGMLLKRLETLGISPDSIDYVMLTHLHNDHTGGLSRGDTAVFSRAEAYVCGVEYDYWVTNGKPDAPAAKALAPYADRLHLFEWGDTLPMGVVAIDAHGHTPGHTAFQCGRLLVVGDLVHGLGIQMNVPSICANFDMDRPEAIASRKRLFDYAESNQLLTAGMHYPFDALLDFLVVQDDSEE